MYSSQALLWTQLISTSVFANLSFAAPSSRHFNRTLCHGHFNHSTSSSPTDQLQRIESHAHGRAPTTQIPLNISSEGITSLQLIAFDELFEVAFFSSLVANISTDQPGFEIEDLEEKSSILEALTTIVAQEELHYLTASKLLVESGVSPVRSCQYTFPTTCFNDAIRLAATFTDLVVGALQDVIEVFAINGDHTITRTIAAVIGQEAEQEALYRLQERKKRIPEAPFATTSSRELAFSALQQFIVPGSCPDTVDLKISSPLALLTKDVQAKDQYLQFEFDLQSLNMIDWSTNQSATKISSRWIEDNDISIAYVNQQNEPIIQPIENFGVNGSMVNFTALFPFGSNLLYGLSLATVVKGEGPLTNVQLVTNQTLFGPALIELA